ncbi:MAG: hypothetical protein M3325_16965 [Actinomycetota bacterium]|nr:hypothetical protein [Actinomycetota bacterium]
MTVLFTDIVGSTKRVVELGDQRWRDVLVAHAAAVRREITRFGGREVKTTGDGFFGHVLGSEPRNPLRLRYSARPSPIRGRNSSWTPYRRVRIDWRRRGRVGRPHRGPGGGSRNPE